MGQKWIGMVDGKLVVSCIKNLECVVSYIKNLQHLILVPAGPLHITLFCLVQFTRWLRILNLTDCTYAGSEWSLRQDF